MKGRLNQASTVWEASKHESPVKYEMQSIVITKYILQQPVTSGQSTDTGKW